MGSATIDVIPYDGSLLAVDLLSGSQTLVLSDFDPAVTGVLVDSDGSLGASDNGISTFNGDPITYIGSGTAEAGVEIATIVVGIPPAVPVVVFSAGGTTYFYYPDGPPSDLSQVAMVVELTPDPYVVINPVCFAEGTLISTPRGDLPIEELQPGDRVVDQRGKSHRILWTLKREVRLQNQTPMALAKLAPVLIPKGSLGRNQPNRDLRLSQQHLVEVTHQAAALYFGDKSVLVPAKALLGGGVRIDYDCESVTYYQILCEEHAIVWANGLSCETLRLGKSGLAAMSRDQLEEIDTLYPELPDMPDMVAAAPVLAFYEGVVLRSAMLDSHDGPAFYRKPWIRTPAGRQGMGAQASA